MSLFVLLEVKYVHGILRFEYRLVTIRPIPVFLDHFLVLLGLLAVQRDLPPVDGR